MQIIGALLCFQKWKHWFSVSKMFILYIFSSSNIVTILKSIILALFLFPNGNEKTCNSEMAILEDFYKKTYIYTFFHLQHFLSSVTKCYIWRILSYIIFMQDNSAPFLFPKWKQLDVSVKIEIF